MVQTEYQRKGIYSALCKETIEIAKREGFQTISSKHMLTNNSILIAKLKLGFKVSGMEMDAVHGTLLKLVYNLNPQMTEALRYRAGEIFFFNEKKIQENFGS